MIAFFVFAFIFSAGFALHYRGRALRAEEQIVRLFPGPGSKPISGEELHAALRAANIAPFVQDPGKQALEMLRRGDDCDWYSINKNPQEMHEGFDCLEIYWQTTVEHRERNDGYGRGPFEEKAGFRVRWHVSAAHTSYVEAYGLDLLTTILEARELADQQVSRANLAARMGNKHHALEDWKMLGPKRKYDFNGLNLETWSVRLEYPGGIAWAEHADLDQAVADALGKAPK